MNSPTQLSGFRLWLARLVGSIAFYTTIPIPAQWSVDFHGIARFAPLVGIGLGGILAIATLGLQAIGLPAFTRSVLLVVLWIKLTGGLHLDGAMDTADGLAVTDPDRRLAVMADSVTGAFGVMAAASILLLKTAALTDLNTALGTSLSPTTYSCHLLLVLGWGRWGQLVAVWRYPYLRSQGKGTLHKAAIRSGWHLVPATFTLLTVNSAYSWLEPAHWYQVTVASLLGVAIAILTGAWFNQKLGGHTGDTYGAVVEWTEALLLCCITAL
ncbi:MAG: adenosylcobinamide-GDP ribazoletransferase [Cyanobacteria bacterium]|nr:adenosylcobinamide-GDP ribazoletransferase [Cyanobacteriota bacterium]MDW8201402.1 adenosylcobinamide-GDP ribazoletransferase [Cyanobacteriota bacterium SKYGB_h_bin112]